MQCNSNMMATETERNDIGELLVSKSYGIYVIHNHCNIPHNDYQILLHNNGIMVITLAKSHFLISDIDLFQVTRVVFEKEPVPPSKSKRNVHKDKDNRQKKKKKNKNKNNNHNHNNNNNQSKQMGNHSITLCSIYYALKNRETMSDRSMSSASEEQMVVKLTSFMDAKLLEVNQTNLNKFPELIQKNYLTYGHLCVLDTNNLFTNSEQVHQYLTEKCQAVCFTSNAPINQEVEEE
jgi:hypothetical protein